MDAQMAQEIPMLSRASLAQNSTTAMSEDTETMGGMQSCPTMLIQLFAQIMTGLHFLESVGATFILWLCPALAPEPRIHRYIAKMPSTQSLNHHHHHHHHHTSHSRSTTSRRRNVLLRAESDEGSSLSHQEPIVSPYDSSSTSRIASNYALPETADLDAIAMARTESWARTERELLAVAK